MGYEKPFVIYLAGGISDWRESLAKRWALQEVSLIDPFVKSPQGSLGQFTHDDLKLVGGSNLILTYHDYHVFDGLAVECGYAFAHGIPIIYVCTQPRLSSMIVAISKAAFTELTPALEFIERRYLND